jgi:hypothetical protein
LPDVSSAGPKRPHWRPSATLHGVVFDIFGWEPKRRGMAARIPPDDAVSAYILSLNGVLPENAVLDVRALSEIKMPNRKMFVGG